MSAITGPRIMITTHAFDSRYFLVDTDEELHRVCVSLIKHLLEHKQFDYAKDDPLDALGIDLEQIEGMQEGHARTVMLQCYEKALDYSKSRQRAIELKEDALRIVATPFDDIRNEKEPIRQEALNILRCTQEVEVTNLETADDVERWMNQ